jgi:lipopolysaccharide export system permease protein
LKIIDWYILKSYLSRLVAVFAICMLIFIVQTFWLYIDELAGKGLDIIIISKFLLYFSPKLVPMVLPMSVLIASLMTYGSFAENYEFAAMKSTGISLQRALIGLLIFHVVIGVGSFYFSNHVIPYGELKSYNLRKNLKKLKPELAIREGIFNEVGNINIKVARKYGENDRFLEDVIIHEYYPDRINRTVIKAKRGELRSKTTDDNLQLVLFEGNRYEAIKAKKKKAQDRMPHAKVYFEEYVMNIDLSSFNDVDLEAEDIKSSYRMQKTDQLRISIDTLERDFNLERAAFSENFVKSSIIGEVQGRTQNKVDLDTFPQNPLHFLANDVPWKYSQAITTGIDQLRPQMRDLNRKRQLHFLQQKNINQHKIVLEDKFVLVFASVLLFLIGAPLGAIVRKGGIGMPLVLSVIIFLTYHFIGVFGKNAAEDNSINPVTGAWLSTLLLTPFAVFLTLRASSDKGFVSFDSLFLWYQKSTQFIVHLYKKIKKHE